MKPLFFKTIAEFREWLEANHETETEVYIGFYKVKSGKPTMKWSEVVDQAICFGWIDGVRNSIDHESYCNRLTPRRKNSNWSEINIQKVKVLTEQGLMKPAGLKAYSYKTASRTNTYYNENGTQLLSDDFIKLFMEKPSAWEFFEKQAPSYKRLTIHWIMSAKQEVTQLRRLNKTIEESENLRRV